MTGPSRRFDPTELHEAGEPDLPAAEQADALRAARELESVAATGVVRPSAGFEDRVMAAIATEPAPRLVVRPAATVRGGRVAAFLIAVRESWGVATTGGRPMAVRAQALAFVLLVVVAGGAMASAAAVGVGGLLDRDHSAAPSLRPGESREPAPSGPVRASQEPSNGRSPEPSESAEPTDSAEPSDSAEPTETSKATETGDPGESGGTRTPRPSRTPHAGETPEPQDTPEPTETPSGTDGSGGKGGGGSGGSGGG